MTVNLEMAVFEQERTTAEGALQPPQAPTITATSSSLELATAATVRPSSVPSSVHQIQTDKQSITKKKRSISARLSGSNILESENRGYSNLEEIEDVAEERSMSHLAPIDEQVLVEVLNTRPTLRLARQMSMRFRAQTAVPGQRKKRYRTLPHGIERLKTVDTERNRRVKRSSSLPNVNDEEISAIALKDIHDMVSMEDVLTLPPTLQRQEDLRKSTRRLKERIQMQ